VHGPSAQLLSTACLAPFPLHLASAGMTPDGVRAMRPDFFMRHMLLLLWPRPITAMQCVSAGMTPDGVRAMRPDFFMRFFYLLAEGRHDDYLRHRSRKASLQLLYVVWLCHFRVACGGAARRLPAPPQPQGELL